MLNSRLACAVAFSSALFLGTSDLHGQQPAQGTALWVAESAGALKLSGTDGHLLFAIGDLSARAILGRQLRREGAGHKDYRGFHWPPSNR
jgi:hypothetical protein